jgi:hypothetical protein
MALDIGPVFATIWADIAPFGGFQGCPCRECCKCGKDGNEEGLFHDQIFRVFLLRLRDNSKTKIFSQKQRFRS